jgi:hypothetical protein
VALYGVCQGPPALLMATEYLMMGKPPSAGANQLTAIDVGVVVPTVGAAGAPGTAASAAATAGPALACTVADAGGAVGAVGPTAAAAAETPPPAESAIAVMTATSVRFMMPTFVRTGGPFYRWMLPCRRRHGDPYLNLGFRAECRTDIEFVDHVIFVTRRLSAIWSVVQNGRRWRVRLATLRALFGRG